MLLDGLSAPSSTEEAIDTAIGSRASQPPAPVPPGVQCTIDGWIDDATDDTERRCRSLRRVAIRHASALDELDTSSGLRHLRRLA